MTKQTLLVGIYSSAKIVQATRHTGFVSFIDHNDSQHLGKSFGSERTDAFRNVENKYVGITPSYVASRGSMLSILYKRCLKASVRALLMNPLRI